MSSEPAAPVSAGRPRRPGLGRGLDALLPAPAPAPVSGAQQETGALTHVPVAAVAPNPNQPRRSFDDDAIDELAASISRLGVLQPLLVRRGPHGLELVAGERRLRAARRAGLSEVPVVMVETDAAGSLERALVENIHRADLNPIEEAAGLRQLLEEGGLTQEALAGRLGRNRVSITNALRLLDLPVETQRLVMDGRLSAGHAKALLGLEGPFHARLARRVAHEGLSVRETEDLVRRYQAMTGAAAARGGGARVRPPEASEAQRRLVDRLQTRVRIDVGKRKGKIVIDFASLEELERVTGIILNETGGGRAADKGAGPEPLEGQASAPK